MITHLRAVNWINDIRKTEVAKLWCFINKDNECNAGVNAGGDGGGGEIAQGGEGGNGQGEGGEQGDDEGDEICPNVAIGGTCEIDDVNYIKVEFTDDCIDLYYGERSCPDESTVGTTVARVVSSGEGLDWITASNACQTGHLATAAEIQQLWDKKTGNGDERLLETLCNSCNRNDSNWFWVADTRTAEQRVYGFDISLSNTVTRGFEDYHEEIDVGSNNPVVCIGN